jgi:hypothetical protein
LATKIIYLKSPILSEKCTSPSFASHDVTLNHVILVARGLLGAISTSMVQSNLISMGPTVIIMIGPVGFSDVVVGVLEAAAGLAWPCTPNNLLTSAS